MEKVLSIVRFDTCKVVRVVTVPTNNVRELADKFGCLECISYYVELPEIISETFFDYIVVSDPNKVVGRKSCITEEIEELGIDARKIIDVSDFYSIEAFSLYSHLKNYFENVDKYKFFITGVSHAFAGTDLSCYRESGLNLALTSQDLFYDYCLARMVLENKDSTQLRDAIIGIAPFSLHYDLSRSSNAKRVHIYVPMVRDTHNYDVSAENLSSIFNDCYYSAYESFSKDALKDDRKGCVAANRGISLEEYMGIRRGLRFWDEKAYPDTVAENMEIINKYLKMCINCGTRPTLVTFPLSSWYVNYFNKQKMDEMKYLVSDVSESYGVNYFDYSKDGRFSDADFYDKEHLNMNGAKKISTILDREVINR